MFLHTVKTLEIRQDFRHDPPPPSLTHSCRIYDTFILDPKDFGQTSIIYAVFEPVRHDPGHAAFFMTCEIELNTKNSTKRRLTAPFG